MADTTTQWLKAGAVVNRPTFGQFLWSRWGWHVIVIGRPAEEQQDDINAIIAKMTKRTVLQVGQLPTSRSSGRDPELGSGVGLVGYASSSS